MTLQPGIFFVPRFSDYTNRILGTISIDFTKFPNLLVLGTFKIIYCELNFKKHMFQISDGSFILITYTYKILNSLKKII